MILGLMEQRILLNASYLHWHSKRRLIEPATGVRATVWQRMKDRGLIEIEHTGGQVPDLVRLSEAGERLKIALLQAGEKE